MSYRRRLISFDIGIRNMAYCIFEWTVYKKKPEETHNPPQNLQIVDWNIINILDSIYKERTSTTTKYVCNEIIKSTKKICGKNAKYGTYLGDSTDSFQNCICETHAKKETKYWIPKKEHSLSFLKKQKVDGLVKLYQTYFPFATIPKKQKMIDDLFELYEKKCYKVIPVISQPSAKQIDLITIGRIMKSKLDELRDQNKLAGITDIIIENQISPLANRMKTIQGMLAQYFIMQETRENHYTIDFVSSINKLKDFQIEKTDYSTNKKDGIRICKQFLEENWRETDRDGIIPLFSKSTKKDDLADCFLQGIWYLKSKNIINYAEDLKINIVSIS